MNEFAQRLFGHRVKVGSHGYVQLVDVMGDDARVTNGARISYGRHELEHDDVKDRRLLRLLMRHRHTSPFEQCEMQFIVRSPMDVWRQWIRHRTASVNEYSTRYTEAIDDMATTPGDAWRLQDQGNKQGSAQGLASNVGVRLTEEEVAFQARARHVYRSRLDAGVAREQARKDLPLSTYTVAYWKIDVHNLMHFLDLRMDEHAQLEIRQFANVIYDRFFTPIFPVIAEAFNDYVLQAVTLSRMEVLALRGLLNGDQDLLKGSALVEAGLEGREAQEFIAKLKTLRG